MDENHIHKHDKPYVVGMANKGEENTNSSQFYITCMRTPWLDNMHVVFGHVVRGQEIVLKMSNFGTNKEAQILNTKKVCRIADCGQFVINTGYEHSWGKWTQAKDVEKS